MVFYGIERNVDEIKSFEGADILWIEEAHNLTKEQWEILEPTIRKEGSEVWISFNPRYATDFIYQKFIVNTPPNTIVRKINYTDNPFISKTMLDIIEDLKERDFEAYEHIYLGVPKSENAQTIIKREWLESAIDLHKSEKIKELGLDLTGQYFVGYDVADSGDDKNATTVVCGSIIEDCTEWQGRENELRKSAEKVKHLTMEKSGKLIYDSIGVGAHVGSTLQASGFFEFYPFNAGAKVFKPNQKYKTIKNKDFFANLKAQAWWLVADRFANTYDFVVNGNHNYKPSELISIDPKIKNLDQLLTELSTPFQDIDSAGRVKVESKKDLAKRGVVSPNKADSCIMALSFNLVAQKSMNTLDIRGF
jgi:phage terminase large subunit